MILLKYKEKENKFTMFLYLRHKKIKFQQVNVLHNKIHW